MNKRKFLQQRRESWRQFRKLIEKSESKSSRKKLSSSDLAEYSRLMREVSNDLAIVHARDWGRELSNYLNSLVTRGYNSYYTSTPGNLRQFLNFVAFGFPRLLRANGGFFLAGWCLFFIPFFVSWGIVQNDPSLASRVLPSEQLDMMESMYAEPLYKRGNGDEEEEESGSADEDEKQTVKQGAEYARRSLAKDGGDVEEEESDVEEEPLIEDESEVVEGYLDQRSFMAGFYVQHNVGIAFRCFAIGILLGIGTGYVLISNGLLIGTVFGYIVAAGHGDRLLSFAVTHGSFELTAIAISGGAGLMLGDAVLHRRNRTLFESLKVRGLDAIKIALGAGVMLVIAAGLEAFWSPSPIDNSIKYAVGGVSWVFVYAWLLFAGRERPS